MKKKNIFLTILCALCIISSCIVTSFYPNVSTATPTKLPETLEQNLTAFILAKKLEQDPKYEYITFEKDTPENIQKDIKKGLDSSLSSAKNIFENDPTSAIIFPIVKIVLKISPVGKGSLLLGTTGEGRRQKKCYYNYALSHIHKPGRKNPASEAVYAKLLIIL